MFVVTVQLRVKKDKIEEFLKHTLHNAENARREPGCLRFDVLRHETEPDRFFFYEVYNGSEDHKTHKTTPHYLAWYNRVPELLSEERVGTRYVNVSPLDAHWR